MKKIILAAEGNHFSEGAFAFVRDLNRLKALLVTGVFVPQINYANLWSYATGEGYGEVNIPVLEDDDNQQVAFNIAHFKTLCDANGIAYSIHKDFADFALPHLRAESRFADAMIVSGELFYQQMIGGGQFQYLQTALHQSECPVLIVPEECAFPKQNIIAYDGSDESVYAMKQFAYVFPELCANETLLVFIEANKDEPFPQKALIEEWATQHFSKLSFQHAALTGKKEFAAWMSQEKAALLVSGSFGRSGLSQAWKRSFVADVIQDHKLPVFVAHR